MSDAPFRHLSARIYSRGIRYAAQSQSSSADLPFSRLLPPQRASRPVCRIMYTYTCSIQRGIHRAQNRMEELLAHSASTVRERGRAQTLFAPQCIPTDGGGEKAAEKAIAAIIRACSSIHYGEQPSQPVSGHSGGVVVKGGRGMGAMNFIMQEPSQWEMLSRWRRASGGVRAAHQSRNSLHDNRLR